MILSCFLFVSDIFVSCLWIFGTGIRLVLLEKQRCPKCLSTRCRVEDLLPNVSLRQAIEHFLESQILNTGSGTAFCQYAPGRKISYTSFLSYTY